MAPKPPKTNNGTPPPIDKLLFPAVGIGLALLAYQFLKGLGAEIPRVNVNDELELREVFFGEQGLDKSYAVLCHPEDSTLPISSVFQDAFNDGSVPAEFRIVDCNYVLPSSEKSIAERFSLNLKQRPTVFLSGKVGEPKQIPEKHLKTGAMLVQYLRARLVKRAAKIETTQDLRSKCLDKDICGLLLKGSKQVPAYLKDAMAKLVKEFPNIAFASIDSTVLYALHLEEYLPELADGQPRFVVFKKVSGSADPKGERLITSVAFLKSNGVSYGQMSNLLAAVVSQSEVMTKLPILPVVKTRTKKLEQEEKAKRERKQQQQQRQHEKKAADSTPGGAFRDNDGSREGRRAERDRRREEHRKEHNVKEKTPEEIAEMERNRRKRMEEEAAKWNIAPEDAPPQGDYFEDGDDEDMQEETITEEVDSTAANEQDDDVIDLD